MIRPTRGEILADFETLAETLERISADSAVDEHGLLVIGHPAVTAVRDWIHAAEARQAIRVRQVVRKAMEIDENA